MIGKTISHYRITEKLGEGGMGVVYKAEDLKLKRSAALKFLTPELNRDPAARTRFIHEAESAAALRHPAICTVYEIDTVDDQTFIAMEYLEGRSLKEHLADGPLPVAEALDLAIRIADGLAEAHGKGVVHRDIKPANVMLTPSGQPVVMDFGLAVSSEATRLTRTGVSVGTPAYMSPEQVQGESVNHQTDIWSLGIMLYEMLAGEPPFRGDTAATLLYAVTSRQPAPLLDRRGDVPVGLAVAVEKALAKDCGSRYQEIDDLLADLRSLRPQATLPPTGLSMSLLLYRLRRSPRRVWALGAILVLALLIPISIWVMRTSGNRSIHKIAVLPLESRSEVEDQIYLADGVTSALIADMAKVHSLETVIAPASAATATIAYDTYHEIADALNVDALVHGSLSQLGNRVRIDIRLIRAANEELIWAESYERDRQHVLDLQGEITRAVVEQLQIELTPQEAALLTRSHIVDPAAYNAYLKGQYHLNTISGEGLEKSYRYFRESIDIDPTFAPAWVGLACYYHLQQISEPRANIYPEAKAAINRALQLDDSIAQAYSEAGILRFYFEWDWNGPAEYFQRAFELEPMNGDMLFWYTTYLGERGQYEEAIAMARRLLELDPLTTFNRVNLGWAYFKAGRHEESIAVLNRAREQDSDLFWIPMELAWNHSALGQYEEAFAEYDRAMALDYTNFETILLATLGNTYALSGREDEARGILDRLDEMAQEGYVDPAFAALIPAGLGDADLLFQWLQRGLEVRSAQMIDIKMNRAFADFRSEPRFNDILRQMNIPID